MHVTSRIPLPTKKPKKNRWAFGLVNALGAVTVTLIISWAIGWPSLAWFQKVRVPNPAPVAIAPARPPNKPIGIAPPRPKGNDSSVSPVALKLLLVNANPGRTLSEGTAQIGVVRESPQTYQGGAVLENGAHLAEIHADYVVLEKANRSVRLYLDPNKSAPKGSDASLAMVGGVKPSPPAPVTNREVLTDYIRPSPVYEGETLVGYQVYPGDAAGPFSQMGLQPGDVITAINGTPLNDPTSAWDALRQLTEGIALSAAVKRHGEIVTVNLDGAIIAKSEEAKSQPAAPPMPPPGM